MDKIIDSRFERLEKALSTLITSISTYNPSPAHATDLVLADQELSSGLAQLTTHQNNHAKIQSLKATSQSLDDQIRNTLLLLTTTRQTLLTTPATTYPSPTNPVSYSELLSYARRISKFTLPPDFREGAANNTNSPPSDNLIANGSEPHTNGSTTPVIFLPVPTNGNTDIAPNASAMDIDPLTQNTQNETQATTQTSSTALPIEISQSLDPFATDPPFVPWPREADIRRGALASIQVLLDQGVDPATFDPERSAQLEEDRKRKVEEEERAREEAEEQRRRDMERRRSEVAGNSGAAGVSAGQGQERPKKFQLDDFDEDDD